MKKINIILLLFILFGCKKTKLEGDLSVLVGKWNWQYTVQQASCDSPSTNVIFASPSVNGFDYSLVFLKKGKLEVYKNGKREERWRLVQTHVNHIGSDTVYNFMRNNKDEGYFNVIYTIRDGEHYLKTAYFPEEIINGFDGCHVSYSLFKKE